MAYQQGKLIHELFEEQVNRSPEETAAEYGADRVTYAELNRRCNQLAACLRKHGVGPDQPVGLFVERSVEMLVGVMGIWKAGGAYVPLDPDYPPERLSYMLADAAPRVVISQEHLIDKLPATNITLLTIPRDGLDIANEVNAGIAFETIGMHSQNLAYIIYTSGSTGRPKGVMIEHRSVVNLWNGLESIYHRSPACRRIALNAPLSFDASVQQIVQLLSGRTIVVIPKSYRLDPFTLLTFTRSNRIDAIDCTPSQLRLWISAGFLESSQHQCSVVLVGGEAIDADLWRNLAHCSNTAFYNVYGPTECTVDATCGHVHQSLPTPHIGLPMENRRIHVLNSCLSELPSGVSGEIYIGGEGVARGYLNRPELTAERFIADPFGHETHTRLYRSGDLGQQRTDGALEYLGRNDDQVKIRGYRIELGEIEAQLTRIQEIKAAAVIAHGDASGEERLVAYVSPSNSSGVNLDLVRTHIGSILPPHMVPAVFVVLENLPLTSNGKLDRRNLPPPGMPSPSAPEHEAPKGKVEEALAKLWKEILQVSRVARRDQFFQLGGDSLAAMRLVVRVREMFSIPFPTHAVFRHPTLFKMARHVEELQSARKIGSQSSSMES